MFLVQQRTRLKNRIQGALARYNIQIAGVSDMFGRKKRHTTAAAAGLQPAGREKPPRCRVVVCACEGLLRKNKEEKIG
jgi:hypothetical protein